MVHHSVPHTWSPQYVETYLFSVCQWTFYPGTCHLPKIPVGDLTTLKCPYVWMSVSVPVCMVSCALAMHSGFPPAPGICSKSTAMNEWCNFHSVFPLRLKFDIERDKECFFHVCYQVGYKLVTAPDKATVSSIESSYLLMIKWLLYDTVLIFFFFFNFFISFSCKWSTKAFLTLTGT